jgi:N-acetylglucosamine malate deacetylase 1
MSGVLVVSPHPDDEAIGCGGTVLRHVDAGDDAHVVFLTSGEAGVRGADPGTTLRQREAEALAAAGVLALSSVEFWRFPDGRLRASTALVGRLLEHLSRLQPAVVYVPHAAEMHPDHRAAARAVRAAVRSLPAGIPRPDVLMFEIWTPLQRLDVIVDITPFVDVKRRTIDAHGSQCALVDFAEAVLGLNRYRGELHCWPEGEYAEVFERMRT